MRRWKAAAELDKYGGESCGQSLIWRHTLSAHGGGQCFLATHAVHPPQLQPPPGVAGMGIGTRRKGGVTLGNRGGGVSWRSIWRGIGEEGVVTGREGEGGRLKQRKGGE